MVTDTVASTSSDEINRRQPMLQRFKRWIRKDPIQLFLYICGGLIMFALLYSAGTNIAEGDFTLERFLRLFVFGLAQGSIYALIALGYTLVYGILGMINFAHGEVFMAGAYIGFFAIYPMAESGFLARQPLIGLTIVLVVGMSTSAIIAVLLERIAYRPLRGAPRLVPLITAIGASVTLQQLFLRLFGGSTRTYPDLNLYVFTGTVREECEVFATEGITTGYDLTRPVFEYERCLGIDVIRGIYEIQTPGTVLYLRLFGVIFLALLLLSVLWFLFRNSRIISTIQNTVTTPFSSRQLIIALTVAILLSGVLAIIDGNSGAGCRISATSAVTTGFNGATSPYAIEECQSFGTIDFPAMEIRVRPLYFIIFTLALFFMSILWFVIQRTKIGKAMRAVAEDKDTAALMGINVDRVIVFTFVTGALLAGAAAVLFALYNRQVSAFMGFTPGIKAFTAAVLGGIGNIPGAMFGGLFLGIIESVAPALLDVPSQLEDVIAFGMLVLILIFRPTGIFGEVLSKKKA